MPSLDMELEPCLLGGSVGTKGTGKLEDDLTLVLLMSLEGLEVLVGFRTGGTLVKEACWTE
jgi:hypothetical protein